MTSARTRRWIPDFFREKEEHHLEVVEGFPALATLDEDGGELLIEDDVEPEVRARSEGRMAVGAARNLQRRVITPR